MNVVQLGIEDGRFMSVNYKGESLLFRYSTYGKMTKGKTDIIFGPTNRYLKTIKDEEKNDNLFEAYRQALDILSMTFEPGVLVERLRVHVKAIREQLSYQDLSLNFLSSPDAPKCLDTDEKYTTSNPKETTYLRQEAVDLTVYSALIKTLAPIFGLACRVLGTTSGNTFKEMDVAEIITGSGFELDPPYVRLEVYARSYAARRKPSTTTAVKFMMAAEDLELYIMALFVIRRLVPYEYDDKMSILRYGYQFIEGKLTKLKRGYTDKFANVGGGDGDSDSLVDHYRISEAIPTSIKVATNSALKDIPMLLRGLKVDYLTVKDVEVLYQTLVNEELEISAMATPIIALCLNDVIHRSVLDTVDRPSKLIAISICSLIYRHHGFNDIADWLTHRRVTKEVTKISLGLIGNIANKLEADIGTKLSARYPNLPKGMKEMKTSKFENPGLALIDMVVRMIHANDWPESAPDAFVDIRNSLAKILILPPYSR